MIHAMKLSYVLKEQLILSLILQLPQHIEILLSAVTHINEPDSLYGIIQSHKVSSHKCKSLLLLIFLLSFLTSRFVIVSCTLWLILAMAPEFIASVVNNNPKRKRGRKKSMR